MAWTVCGILIGRPKHSSSLFHVYQSMTMGMATMTSPYQIQAKARGRAVSQDPVRVQARAQARGQDG